MRAKHSLTFSLCLVNWLTKYHWHYFYQTFGFPSREGFKIVCIHLFFNIQPFSSDKYLREERPHPIIPNSGQNKYSWSKFLWSGEVTNLAEVSKQIVLVVICGKILFRLDGFNWNVWQKKWAELSPGGFFIIFLLVIIRGINNLLFLKEMET